MKLTTINQLQTAYYTGGTGQRDVLLLHGWASSGRMWLRTMWAMRHGYRLWALDLPGFGDSECPKLEWASVEHYTDHAEAFCAAMGIHPYAVIGHSMGGRIALDLGRRYPHRAEKLVTISASITGKLGFNLDVFMMGFVGRTLKRISERVWPVATASVMAQYWAPKYLGSEAANRTTKDLQRSNHDAVFHTLEAMARHDYSPHLHEVLHPTLIIVGKQDYTVPPRDSEIAARHLPKAHLLILDHIHHQPTDECLDTCIGAVEKFLSADDNLRGSEAVL